ncbi:hypothetical protein PVAP13_7KG382300 [Panicum virgatum]|jgi:hypothetical protein|uniref:Uncharacterized protein n=1 Tax=Panicum virgatum TaxID=38727 RepID=A0A8T0QRL7_PANVG|nr:hypothetical protein PVAP13_7KG382300 [Panicum virgatum]
MADRVQLGPASLRCNGRCLLPIYATTCRARAGVQARQRYRTAHAQPPSAQPEATAVNGYGQIRRLPSAVRPPLIGETVTLSAAICTHGSTGFVLPAGPLSLRFGWPS